MITWKRLNKIGMKGNYLNLPLEVIYETALHKNKVIIYMYI